MTTEVLNKLGQSIVSNDIYILMAAVIEVGLFVVALLLAKGIIVKFDKKDNGKKGSNNSLIVIYNIFTVGISIFPLLGMFGTVAALLGLDLAAGDMENIKNNFFSALTSTAWGIIFSIGFKIIHALTEYYFENKIKESTELMEECNKILEKENG